MERILVAKVREQRRVPAFREGSEVHQVKVLDRRHVDSRKWYELDLVCDCNFTKS